MLTAQLKAIGVAVLSFLVLMLTLGAFRAGKKSEKADNLSAHIKGGKAQRSAEQKLDSTLEEEVDEIRNTKSKRGSLTDQPRL